MSAFQGYLLNRNIVAIRRAGKGQDISAACGQLKGLLERKSGDDKQMEAASSL
jgi:23S rRNA (adenine2503-C2)-methyltransferase